MNLSLHRLQNQHIASSTFDTPGEVVSWLGAVQAQDYLGALWAVGLRMRNATEGDVERALAERTIVRTWPMRGTLHFVAAADVRWMLELMTPRVVAASAARLQRDYELDDAVFARSRDVLTRALQGGGQLTRNAMYETLEAAHISAAGQRGLHILWRLAQEGLLCFGAREGKQPTFVLLDEWVPDARCLERDEALMELARRYFTGHGPATVQDFAWWSGLAVADAKAGLEMAKADLVTEVVDGKTYWFSSSTSPVRDASPDAYLLPSYDEYTVAYKDRGAVLDPVHAKRPDSGSGIFHPTMILDGQVVGTWKRTLEKKSVVITTRPFNPLKKAEKNAFAKAARRYGEFLGLPAAVRL
jgi:Winged helix DNA-binding domain